jgi:TatD DNase family protein
MELIDTHTHLFLPEFDDDRKEVFQRARANNVTHFLLPNIDSSTLPSLMTIYEQYRDVCSPMIGLHPTSVGLNFEDELSSLEQHLGDNTFIGIGEIGIDLFWDKSHLGDQIIAFRRQLDWSVKYNLPVVIHSRDSFDEIMKVLDDYTNLQGVFHCFCGDVIQAQRVIDKGLMLGIGGVVTFKNGGLDRVIKNIPLEYILLETDSPYLSPVPFRGKRNESSYILKVAEKIAQITGVPLEEVARVSTSNARRLFHLSHS